MNQSQKEKIVMLRQSSIYGGKLRTEEKNHGRERNNPSGASGKMQMGERKFLGKENTLEGSCVVEKNGSDLALPKGKEKGGKETGGRVSRMGEKRGKFASRGARKSRVPIKGGEWCMF